MDYPKFILSNQEEESIIIQRVKPLDNHVFTSGLRSHLNLVYTVFKIGHNNLGPAEVFRALYFFNKTEHL